MNLRSLSNQELNSKLSTCIQKEREVLSEILRLIVEVNRRKLYLDLAYPSLFEYLVKHHCYSAGSAYRRIEAARLMRDIPDLPEKLESGALNLSQVSLVQKSIKLSQNKKQVQISKEEKQTLLTSLENKSFTESQVLVSKVLDIPVQDQAKILHQKDESVRIEMTLSKSQWQKVKHMQELLSNSFPNGNDIPKLLEYLADKVIRQKTVIRQGKSQKNTTGGRAKHENKINEAKHETKINEAKHQMKTNDGKHEMKTNEAKQADIDLGMTSPQMTSDQPIAQSRTTMDSKTKAGVSRSDLKRRQANAGTNLSGNEKLFPQSGKAKRISVSIWKTVLQRDQCCQYKDPKTQTICGSRYFLQADHVKPQWAGGGDSAENLQVLCAAHNQYRYRLQSQVKLADENFKL